MKKLLLFTFICALLLCAPSALAAKARGIESDADSAFHANHLQLHIGGDTCRATGNYIKTRSKAGGKQVIGHLEQADAFKLLDIQNGYAQIEVLFSDKTSPDSFVGMTGWVDADYVDCGCSDAAYKSLDSMSNSPYFPDGTPTGWTHLSGAGAWSTELRIQENGTFRGYFHDWDGGGHKSGDYPHGVLYECSFSGRFSNIRRLDEFVYAMTISELYIENEPDTSFVLDGQLHIATDASCFSLGDEIRLYLPGAAQSLLTEEQLSWLHGVITDPLSDYALCNMNSDIGLDPGCELP